MQLQCKALLPIPFLMAGLLPYLFEEPFADNIVGLLLKRETMSNAHMLLSTLNPESADKGVCNL